MYEVHYTGIGYNYRYITDHEHKFPNTGLLKSWCTKCYIEARFNRDTGLYEAQEKPATDG